MSIDAREMVVTRFTRRGTLDTSFGVGGQMTLLVDEVDTIAVALAVQPDDRLVIVGSRGAGEAHGMLFVRLTADGDLDPTFSADGVRVFDGGQFSFLDDVAVDRRGRIVAVGSIGDGIGTDPVVVRLRADGSRDPRFGTRGVSRLRREFPQVRYGGQIEIAASGHLLVSIQSLAVEGEFYAVVARLRANGTLDPTFGVDGLASVGNDAANQVYPVGLDIDSAGRIVALVHGRVESGPWTARVAVLTPDGEPDTAFSGDGFLVMPGFVARRWHRRPATWWWNPPVASWSACPRCRTAAWTQRSPP